MFQNREMRCVVDFRQSALLRVAPPPSHCPGETPTCQWVWAALPVRLGQLKKKGLLEGSKPPLQWGPLRSLGREDWFQSCQDLFFRGPSLAFSTLNITFRDLGCLLCNMGTGEAPGLGVPCALLGRTHHPIPGKDAVAWAHTCLCSHGCEDVRQLAGGVHVCLW